MPEPREVIEARENMDNRAYFEKIVKEMPLLIEWANDEIRDDKEIMMEAVKRDGGALEFASDRLKDDKDILITSVSRSSAGQHVMQVID